MLHNNLFSLKDKVAVVTGSSSGIGKQMAIALSQAGAKTVILGRNEKRLKEAEDEIKKNGECLSIVVDLLQEGNIQTISEQIIKNYGIPDIVVNAAGINSRQKAENITSQSWDEELNINLKIPFFFARCFLDGMKRRGSGKIINISSLQSVRAFDNSIPYGASKGGINQLTRAMAQEYSKHGIQINAIAPGFFKTGLTAPVFGNKEKVKEIANQTAIGRNGFMEDFDGITIFLASKASDYITGQTIFLDGGFTAK